MKWHLKTTSMQHAQVASKVTGIENIPPVSPAAEIRKLTELLEEEIITPEEWQSAKAKIVGLKQDQIDEAVKLLRALHQLVTLGGLTEGR